MRQFIFGFLVLCWGCSSSSGSEGTTGAADTGADGDVVQEVSSPGDAADGIDTSDLADIPQSSGDLPDPTADVELPPPNGVAQFKNCSEPEGSRNIYDLQDPQCPDHIKPPPTEPPGVAVSLTGVVVTAVFGDTLFVQEQAGGAYSGIAVFSHGLPTMDLQVGDVLDLNGNFQEYFENTQIFLIDWEVTGKVTPLQPFMVSHAAHVATGGVMAEMMEGVLVQVSDVTTIHTKPDCPQDWGEFMVTGELRVDDAGYQWGARLGDHFEHITGPLYFGFGNYKVQPRTAADLVVLSKGAAGSLSKCIESDCIIPKTETGSGQIIINEIMADPFGDDDGQEWIELYNPGAQEVSLDGWQLKDCGGQVVDLIGAALVVPSKGFLVLGSNSNPVTNGGVPVDHAYGEAFYLPNTVGSVILFDGKNAFAKAVDHARYSAFEPFMAYQTGRSMERISPTSDGTEPDSWALGNKTFGNGENQGTPGKKNTN